MQAMRHGSVPLRQLMPRILQLLAFDNKDNVVFPIKTAQDCVLCLKTLVADWFDVLKQAMRHGSVPSRQLVPRILHLLAFDNKDNVVGRLLESTRGVPLWLWLAWIPQLLLGLQHPEKDVCKRLLLQIATAFPQVYSLSPWCQSQGSAAHGIVRKTGCKLENLATIVSCCWSCSTLKRTSGNTSCFRLQRPSPRRAKLALCYSLSWSGACCP